VAVEFTNINSILSFYDKNDESNYKVYRGTKCQHVADQYLKGNKEEGAEQLEKFLENLNNANEYVLQMISVKNSKELAPSCIFKLEKKEERQQVGNFYNNNAEVLSRLASIENNLNNINTNEEQDYTEEQPKNFLGQILENESVKEMLITSIGALLTNLLQPKFQTSTVLAGIDESEETAQTAEESLKILFQKGLTVNDLFLLSKKTKTELNYLLKMLRS
jgi:hypothetical protein